MKEKLKQAMAKKGHKDMSDVEKKARMSVAEGLKQFADGEMKSRGLKKVTVASDSTTGLKKGLDVAKDKLAEMEEHGSSDGDMSDVSEDQEAGMVDDAEDGENRDHDVMSGSAEEQNDSRMEKSYPDMMEGMEDDEDEASIEKKLRDLMSKRDKLKSKKMMK